MSAAISGTMACMVCMFAPFFAIKHLVERYSLGWLGDYLLVEVMACILFLAIMGLSFWSFWLVHNWVDMKTDKWHNERGTDFRRP